MKTTFRIIGVIPPDGIGGSRWQSEALGGYRSFMRVWTFRGCRGANSWAADSGYR